MAGLVARSLILVALVGAVGCSGSGGTSTTTPTLQSIELATGEGSVEVGASVSLVATGHFSDGTSTDISGSVRWSTSDQKLSTIDASGRLTGFAQGGVDVTVVNPATGLTATGHVEVVNGQVTIVLLSVTPSTITLGVSFARQLRAEATFSNGLNVDFTNAVTWTSSNPNVAPVSNSGPTVGLMSGLSSGFAEITATHDPTGTTATADVAIQNANGANLTGVTVAPLSVNANQSDVFKLTATGTFDDGTSQDITSEIGWVSSDTTVVAVDSDHPGTFVATLGGSANVTATAGSITSDPVAVTVTAVTFEDLTINADHDDIDQRDTLQLSSLSNAAGVSFDTTQLAHWTSSDPTVASIGDVIGHKALVTGINPGTVSITATLLDSGLTATISITVHEISLTGLAIDSTSFRFVPGEKSTLEVRGTFDNGKTFSVAPDMTWTSDNAAIAVVTHGVLHAPVDAATWAAVTRGTATVTGTYPGTSQTIALSVTKGEYLHRTVGGGAEEDLDMLPGQASTLLWIQRDPVTVHAGTNASVYVLAAQAATSTMSISAFGDAVGVYDATTAGDIKLTTASTAEVNPQLVNSQGSAPISGSVTIASLGDVLQPAFVQARGTLCTLDTSGTSPVCNSGSRTDVTTTAGVMRRPDLGTQTEPVPITRGLGNYWTRPGAPTHFAFNVPVEGQGRIWNIRVTSTEPIVLESFDDLGFSTDNPGVESLPPTVSGQVTTQRILPTALRTIRVTLGAASHATQAQFELDVIYENQGPALVYDTCPPDQTSCPLLPFTAQVGGTPYTAATANGVGDFSSYFYDVEVAGTYTVTLTATSDDVELQLQGFIKNSDGSRGGILSGPDVACNDLNVGTGAFSGTCSVTLDAPSYLGIVVLGGFTDDDFGAVFTINVAED